jgi:hypothetical protein
MGGEYYLKLTEPEKLNLIIMILRGFNILVIFIKKLNNYIAFF